MSAGRDAKRRPSVGAVLDGACNIYCKILLSAEDPNLKAWRAMVERPYSTITYLATRPKLIIAVAVFALSVLLGAAIAVPRAGAGTCAGGVLLLPAVQGRRQ